MFELLVPAEKAQLEKLKGDKKAYDLELRPRLMVQSIEQLQDAQVEPDVWKIEGLDRREDCAKGVATARRGGGGKVNCSILGGGTKGGGRGGRRRRGYQASPASPWVGPTSGSRLCSGVIRSPRGRPLWLRWPAAIGSLWTLLKKLMPVPHE